MINKKLISDKISGWGGILFEDSNPPTNAEIGENCRLWMDTI
jgi:hypothetical protein